MATIGIYDSGIGGLTTLKILSERFKGNDFFYLADNLHHPFGTMDVNELRDAVNDGITRLKSRCDVAVLACNTASTIYDGNDVIRLLPPVALCSVNPDDTLLMATDNTRLNTVCDCVKQAETAELATLIEIQASIGYTKKTLDMSALYKYLAPRLYPFRGVKNVILGCSHYPYCKKEISRILGNVRYFDGNGALVKELEALVTPLSSRESKIDFAFTGGNEKSKYIKLLEMLKASNI